jgi:hypothetical protein
MAGPLWQTVKCGAGDRARRSLERPGGAHEYAYPGRTLR